MTRGGGLGGSVVFVIRVQVAETMPVSPEELLDLVMDIKRYADVDKKIRPVLWQRRDGDVVTFACRPKLGAESRKRTEDAYVEHLMGETWQAIATRFGYRSRQGAQTAVARMLADNPPDTPKAALRAWLERKRVQRKTLFDSMRAAAAEGNHQGVAQLSAALTAIDSDTAKVLDFYAPENINVNVSQTPAAIIATAKQQLLDAIDAEVVEPPKSEELMR